MRFWCVLAAFQLKTFFQYGRTEFGLIWNEISRKPKEAEYVKRRCKHLPCLGSVICEFYCFHRLRRHDFSTCQPFNFCLIASILLIIQVMSQLFLFFANLSCLSTHLLLRFKSCI